MEQVNIKRFVNDFIFDFGMIHPDSDYTYEYLEEIVTKCLKEILEEGLAEDEDGIVDHEYLHELVRGEVDSALGI